MRATTITILVILSTIFAVWSCSPKIYPPSTNTAVHVVDSVAWHDSTVLHHINQYHVIDLVPMLDTLKIETDLAESVSYLDTASRTLRGHLNNKDIDIPVKIKWKEKIVYKDSIVTKEIPVPYETIKEVKVIPSFFWICLIVIILELVWVFCKAFKKGWLRWPF